MADLVGRNGSNVSKLEVKFKVVIDIDRRSRNCMILGRQDHVDAAKEAVECIVDGIEEEITVHADVKKLLTSRDQQRAKDLEDAHMVRIRTRRSPSDCSVIIRGKQDAVNAVKADLSAMLASGKKDKVETRFLGGIIGKKGAQIRALEAEFGVEVMIEDAKRSATHANVAVYGDTDSMTACWDKIYELIEENTIHTEPCEMDSEMIPQFIGKKGSNMNKLRKLSNARIDIARPSNKVTLRGTASELVKCRAAIAAFKENWYKTNYIEVVPTSTGSVLTREKVAELRKEHGANIQFIRDRDRSVKTSKLIVTGAEDQVAAAKAAIKELIGAVTSESIEISPREIATVIGQKGRTINKIQKESGAQVNVNDAGETVTVDLCGDETSVAKARELLDEILDTYRKENREFPVHPKVVDAMKRERGGRNAAVIGSNSGCRVVLPREQGVGTIILRGDEATTEKAQELIKQTYGVHVFETTAESHVVKCAVVEGYMGAVVGKSMTGLKELQDDHGVTALVFDSSPNRGRSSRDRESKKDGDAPDQKQMQPQKEGTAAQSYVLLVGNDAEACQNAKMALVRRLSRIVKVNVEISARTFRLQRVFGDDLHQAMRKLEIRCGRNSVTITIQVEPKNSKVHIKGVVYAAEKAKAIIEAASRGRVVVEIPVLNHKHLEYIQESQASNISQIRTRNNVDLVLDTEADNIRIAGLEANARKAEQAVHECLVFCFPKSYFRAKIPGNFASTLRQNRFKKVQDMQKSTNTKIDLNDNDMFIRGEDVSEARAQIEGMLLAHKKEFAEMVVNPGLIGKIIGSKGSKIRELSEQSGARIDIDKRTNNVLIRGKPEQVLAAKALIEAIVKEDADRRLTFEVDPDMCPVIIGRGGETIQGLQSESNTRINVDKHSSKITITGDPENVLKAKELIDAVLKRQQEAEEERRSRRIMEQTREESERGGRGGRGGGSRDDDVPPGFSTSGAVPPGFAPLEKVVPGLAPKNARKNRKRAQKRAERAKQDEFLDNMTESSGLYGCATHTPTHTREHQTYWCT